MIEDLLRAVQALQQQEPMGAHIEMPEGGHNPADTLEGNLEDETTDGRDDNPFHEAGTANQVEESLMIQGMMAIAKEEGQDWGSHSLSEDN
ncbi:hypothetical protein SLEP1_g22595 [Rubroshorea leprosula]|uniref:Uncharacterized protein n=1 Tax=Rubroshorea leprosula TaxID=152421 RepID=A0AAV5JF14_9ROSI|nr:hypothetical protein SLEP1_g22595 [Rubroshorea leprosula]